MHRTLGWVLLGIGVGLLVVAGAIAGQRRHGPQGADCGTAYSPSELVEYRPVETSAGCAGAFDTIENVVIAVGAAGATAAVAGVATLVTGRFAVARSQVDASWSRSYFWWSSWRATPSRPECSV